MSAIFEGKSIQVTVDDSGIAELCFNQYEASVNKFDQLTRDEFQAATSAIAADNSIKGVLVTSGKPVFIVGADINEFSENAKKTEQQMCDHLVTTQNTVFNPFEDLDIPKVVCINGIALGGGLEMALLGEYRVMASTAKIGLPEVLLGIIPGWGGTVRLPRVIGADNAIEWITSGKHVKAPEALSTGAVDAVVEPGDLRTAGMIMLEQCLSGKLDFRAKRDEKRIPLKLNAIELDMTFGTAMGMIAAKAGKHYPAPMAAANCMLQAATLGRQEAQLVEAKANAKLSKDSTSTNLTGIFLGDQELIKKAKGLAKAAKPIGKSAVIGAGIMGGGIAYQTAVSGMPIIMKDIDQKGLDLGLSEASKLLSKLVSRGKIKPQKMAETLTRIQPTLSLSEFSDVDIVVEAVVEKVGVKQAVLAEVESVLNDTAVLTSNTSTISITQLATALKSPDKFCGMHFFNPVHKMPLVEVIRGKHTSDDTIARTVSYALAMGKKPVVVNDCPGFLVNRVLNPYLISFAKLVSLGVTFTRIDKVMERFGWPMGPAYLSDVIGLDTLKHGEAVVVAGYPDRLSIDFTSCQDVMADANRLGQKTGSGYYQYETDKRGRLKKVIDPVALDMVANIVSGEPASLSDEDIVAVMMLPMAFECVRCLEEGIASSATDIDMALIYGLGFPSFRGGALRYLDEIGLQTAMQVSQKFSQYGSLYEAPKLLKEMAESNAKFYHA